MRRVLLAGLIAGLAGAAGPAAAAADAGARFYYGIPGSEDYFGGRANRGPETDLWSRESDMPSPLMDLCCAADPAHVYAVSGYDDAYPKRLFRFDPSSGNWATLASPPLYIANGGAAVIGDTLYYCSGYSYLQGVLVDTVQKYSIGGNDWTLAAGPFSDTGWNWQPLVIACGGRVYFVSGCSEPGASNPTRQVRCYSPGQGWVRKADMNRGRVFAAGWCWNDTIWVAGGLADEEVLTHTEFYDPVADTWVVDNNVFPEMPVPVWGAGSGVVTSIGFIAGGVNASGQLQDTCLYFNHAQHSWSLEPGLCLKVYRTAGCGTPDLKAFLCGGSTGEFNTTSLCQAEQLASGLVHDVGVTRIAAPESKVNRNPIVPRAVVRNLGTSSEADIQVFCWVDSAGTRVFEDDVVLAGPLEPGTFAEAVFNSEWAPGPFGTVYDVKVFTALAEDQDRVNDTLAGSVESVDWTLIWSSPTLLPEELCRTACCTEPVADGYLVHVVCGNCYAHVSHPFDEVYDPVANTWRTGLAHPRGAGLGVHNHDAVRIGDVIWCGGGSSGETGFYNFLTRLDLVAGTWTEAAEMPVPDMIYYAFEEDGQYLYCFGGVSDTVVLDACFRYDPVANTWSALPEMPGPRRNPMTACVGDTIYVIGGMEANNHTSTRGTVWKYSISGNTWLVAYDTLPDNLGWGKAVAYEGVDADRIYVWGGYRAGSYTNASWRKDETGGWTAETPVPVLNRSQGGDISGSDIWSTGGYNGTILNVMHKGTIVPTGVKEGRPTLVWDQMPDPVVQTVVRGVCRIRYTVRKPGRVRIAVYDVSGALVRVLADGPARAGDREAVWDCADTRGRKVGCGTYFCRVESDCKPASVKVVVLD